MSRRVRVLVGKPGLDGHDRGAKVVAAALRDAGMEVIYTGLHQTPVQIVEAALQEDVDVVALSILSGAHMTLFPEVHDLMVERGLGDRLLTGGGIIPSEDMETLARQGVGRLFGPGASTQDIARYLRECFRERHGEEPLGAPAPPAAARNAEWGAVAVAAPARRVTAKRTASGTGRPRRDVRATAKRSRNGARPKAARAKATARATARPARARSTRRGTARRAARRGRR